jgi:hypothetical protein
LALAALPGLEQSAQFYPLVATVVLVWLLRVGHYRLAVRAAVLISLVKRGAALTAALLALVRCMVAAVLVLVRAILPGVLVALAHAD